MSAPKGTTLITGASTGIGARLCRSPCKARGEALRVCGTIEVHRPQN